MSKCRFIVLGDGQSYTTANELGHYMETKGIKFTSDKTGSKHFGSLFNRVLCSYGRDRASYGEEDIRHCFPKLITKDSDGNSIHDNDVIVEAFLKSGMCQPSSVAVCSKGFEYRGLDLYKVTASYMLVTYCGKKQNIQFEQGDFEFLDFIQQKPYLEYTKRLDCLTNVTSQQSLIPKFNEGVIKHDKTGHLV